ncbi:MAG: hypothetical protein AAB610_00655 [Patescibacteria group bacterium]
MRSATVRHIAWEEIVLNPDFASGQFNDEQLRGVQHWHRAQIGAIELTASGLKIKLDWVAEWRDNRWVKIASKTGTIIHNSYRGVATIDDDEGITLYNISTGISRLFPKGHSTNITKEVVVGQ